MAPINIQSDFRVIDIYFLGRNIFTNADYLPSDVTDLPVNIVVSTTTENSTGFTGVTSLISRAANQPVPSDSHILTPEDIWPFHKAGAKKIKSVRKPVRTIILTDRQIKKRKNVCETKTSI